MKIAKLYAIGSRNKEWETPMGCVRIYSGPWPEIIMWNGRPFLKVTIGMEQEWYRETTMYQAKVLETLP